MASNGQARVFAGVPVTNLWLYRRVRFQVGDPAALIEIPGQPSLLILRDIEMERAKAHARADRIACPADFTPEGGLSGDRETATAQSVGECLRRAGVKEVRTDRALPMIFAHYIEAAGVRVVCDPELGVLERRAKDDQEIEHLRTAQRVTEEAMELACTMVARADAGPGGILRHDGDTLTSERVRQAIDVFLLGKGFAGPPAIVAGGPEGADCHNKGAGPLRTGQPVIIDIFPQDRATLYNGDCTRTVVHGDIPDVIARMHEAVVEAKAAATAACTVGATGEDVHNATARVIRAKGFEMGLPPEGGAGGSGAAPDSYIGMVHGTGHGVGLEVHEPPLLDRGGPALVRGDALTVEPGLYGRAVGGIRVEDMVIVTDEAPLNLNSLHEGLDWR